MVILKALEEVIKDEELQEFKETLKLLYHYHRSQANGDPPCSRGHHAILGDRVAKILGWEKVWK